MAEQCLSDPAISLQLSRTLDEIGLSTVTAKRRRHTYLFTEQLQSIYHQLNGNEQTSYNFGSQTEGATTRNLHSDLDTLTCLDDINVIQDWSGWEKDKVNLLMLQEETAPGYCRLQLLKCDKPEAEQDSPNEFYVFDDRGRVLLKNTSAHQPMPEIECERNGPAMSQGGKPGLMDSDTVVGLPCRRWYKKATEFIRRPRRHDWPSQDLIQQATSHGFFLVPVGYKLSPSEELEWRISPSLVERYLMFSLGIVHIKCYVLLKILMKTFVEPRFGKCISSYHCKTALLHCVENTESGYWRDGNLIKCVTRCLAMFLNWVDHVFCPNFIIPEENLFVGKVTAHNREVLYSVFADLIKSNGRALLLVEFDDLGQKLGERIQNQVSLKPVNVSVETVAALGELEYNRHGMISVWMKAFVTETTGEPNDVISSVYTKIVVLKGQLERADQQQRQAIKSYIAFFSSWLGSLLASLSLANKKTIPKQAIQLLRVGAKFDISCLLKLASVYYCKGDVLKAKTILQTLETHFRRNEIMPVCYCNDNHGNFPMEYCHMMYLLKGTRSRASQLAHCLRFSEQEIHCAAQALRDELRRSVGDEVIYGESTPKEDWMVLAAVDCLPYIYYLQYMIYLQMNNSDLRKQSLEKLERCIRMKSYFRHLETALTFLGQCFELEGDLRSAMTCYRKSLEIRPSNNAANWHEQNLGFKMARRAQN